MPATVIMRAELSLTVLAAGDGRGDHWSLSEETETSFSSGPVGVWKGALKIRNQKMWDRKMQD